MALVDHRLENDVLTLSLNRPEKRNAVSVALLEEFDSALALHGSGNGARVLVLRGNGGCFCAGADIMALNGFDAEGMRGFHDLRERVMSRIEEFPGPTLAVVEGFALGTGLELALCADFRLAARNAQFGLPSSKLGVTESYHYIARLVRAVGLARTQFLVLTGERLDAVQAREFGLAEIVVPPDEVAAKAEEVARTLAANAFGSMAASKRVARHCWRDPLLKEVDDPARPFVDSAGGREIREGTGAFLEKRPPSHTG